MVSEPKIAVLVDTWEAAYRRHVGKRTEPRYIRGSYPIGYVRATYDQIIKALWDVAHFKNSAAIEATLGRQPEALNVVARRVSDYLAGNDITPLTWREVLVVYSRVEEIVEEEARQ